MKRREVFEWDDSECKTREEYFEEYILDELHGFAEELDLSEKTIRHLHKIISKVNLHLRKHFIGETE